VAVESARRTGAIVAIVRKPMGMQRYTGGRAPYDDFGEGELSLSPDTLAQYEAVMPGAAERILRLAEERAAQRHEFEQARLVAETRKAYVALGVGGGLAGFGLCIGAGIALNASAFGGLVVIALSFIIFGAIFSTVAGQRQAHPASPERRVEAPRPISAFDL
jgi:uncharacterized membrane protein